MARKKRVYLMRDRLVDLINEAKDEYPTIPHVNCCKPTFAYYLADHLIANGVIVPPCKVGDTVYVIVQDSGIWEFEVRAAQMTVGVNGQGIDWMKWCFVCKDAIQFKGDDIGKTVFLTREEAEQAMKGENHAEIH